MAITVQSATRAAQSQAATAIEYIGLASQSSVEVGSFYEMQAVMYACQCLQSCRQAEHAAAKAAKAERIAITRRIQADVRARPAVSSLTTREGFLTRLAENAPLRAAVAIRPTIGGLLVETTDDHAVHAVEILARQRGLLVRRVARGLRVWGFQPVAEAR